MDKRFIKRLKNCLVEVGSIYKKHGIRGQVSIRFPSRSTVPFLSKIALWVVNKQGGIIDTYYEDAKESK